MFVTTSLREKGRLGPGCLAHLYSCDGEAYMTVVNGKILYKDGEYFTIDTEKLKYEIGE